MTDSFAGRSATARLSWPSRGLPSVGRLDGHADPFGRAAGSHGSHGHHPRGSPGMDPLEIESLVTFPIESALNGAAGVRRVRSATAVGVAVVWVEFDWGQDINRARQNVTEKLTLVSGSLPPNVEPPFLAPVSRSWARCCSLTSNRTGIRRWSSAPSRKRRSPSPAGRAGSLAGDRHWRRAETIRVVLDPARLAAHQVTLGEVEEALTAANKNATAGFQVAQGQEYLVRGVGRLGDIDAIAAVSVKTTDAAPVLVRDIGSFVKARPSSGVRFAQRQASRDRGSETARREHAGIDRANRRHPGGRSTCPASRDADPPRSLQAGGLHRAVAEQPVHAFIEGAALVILVVVVFLMNVRPRSLRCWHCRCRWWPRSLRWTASVSRSTA